MPDTAPTKSPVYPGLLTTPRLTTLCASLFVALCSGTNYVYSAYSPQLGMRLQISHTQLNIVGLAGSVGVYSSAPAWGRIVDSRGPRILLVSAFLLLLTGYSGIRYIFDSGVPLGANTISTPAFLLLVVCGFMTGAGGNGGLQSSVNSTAKTFPDKARGSATGIVLSGFGLSAFLFSTISHVAFADNTSSFLGLLAFGTALPMVLGFFLVRPIPLPPADYVGPFEQEGEIVNNGGDREEARLLERDAREDSHSRRLIKLNGAPLPNVYGKNLFLSNDFWLLSSILSILGGTGLMYINNVGSMSQVLYFNSESKNGTLYNPTEAARWQADQVSAISLMNFSGRIAIGFISDFYKNKLFVPRSYCLVLVSFFFFVSQIVAANVDDVHNLRIASILLGFAHGSVFSLFPMICLEWFGLPHFSENWGYLSISPLFAGNLFSIAFGRDLDAHETALREPPHVIHSLVNVSAVGAMAAPRCHIGRLCYINTLYMTIGACFFSMTLSVWAGWRDRRKLETADGDRERRIEIGDED